MHFPSTWLAASALALGGPAAAHLASPSLPSPADDPPVILLRAEKVIVRPGESIANGRVLVRDGRIEAVGTELEAPPGATVIEGQVVCAGFLDAWSSLGMDSGALSDGRTDAATRTVEGWDPYDSDLPREEARHAGVLAVRVQAGARSAFGGLGAWVSTGPGAELEQLVLLEDANIGATVGLSDRSVPDVFDRISMVDKLVDEIRSGLDYDRDHAKYARELAAWKEAIAEKEAELEKNFKKAKKDRDKAIEKAKEDGKEHKEERYKEDKKPRAPKFDAEKAALARAANGEVPLVVEVHRAGELRELLARTAEFGRLRLVIAGGTEALHVAEKLAARHIPVIVHPVPLGSGRQDHLEASDLSLAAQLAEKDVTVLFGSGGGAASRDLPLLAALAIGHGLDAEAAFAALTYQAARAFDVADRVGSVQRGRQADLLVLDGEPFGLATTVTHALIGGRVVVSPEEGN